RLCDALPRWPCALLARVAQGHGRARDRALLSAPLPRQHGGGVARRPARQDERDAVLAVARWARGGGRRADLGLCARVPAHSCADGPRCCEIARDACRTPPPWAE